MTNILLVVVILLLVDIYQQLKKQNERADSAGTDKEINKK